MSTEAYLTSRKNQLFVHLHKLQTSRAYREETRQFCADGIKLLDEALRHYPGLHTVIACEGLDLPELPGSVRLVRVPEGLMQSISSMRTPQGVIFLCDLPEPAPLRLTPSCLILDSIQDPGNLGTILRTADALE
ncbi:MAG: RNA methyltransferase, partial [Oscillospiraceae bacterium]|nr:RNA methyltransferase [Oscillospiraceae bacterium]